MILSAMRRPTRLALLAAALLALRAPAATIHCGTMQWMQRHAGEKLSALAKRAALGPQARSLVTDHFELHYSLRGLHRIKTIASDAALVHLADSLFAALPSSLTVNAADSAVYARLDSLHAPHPAYADTMAAYFEAARAYYVGKLGMHAPSSTVPSHYYSIPAIGGGRYAVDIVDIGWAEAEFRNQEIYALTFPASEGGMLMDNDFLFATDLGPGGIPAGDSIRSVYQGQVIHNYAIDWAAGLKVTCFHEFYHGVQFTYVPILSSPHVWYETGATGMEERNAPEVDDYLQYLPSLFSDLPRMSMFDFPGHLSEYGNGIFHLFLAKEVAEGFDVKVWERLATNGNVLPEALAFMFAAYERTSRDVFAKYAAQLAFAGTPYKPPFAFFDEDVPRWPRLQLNEVDLKNVSGYTTGIVYAFSLQAIRYTGAEGAGKALILRDSLLVPVRARLGRDTSSIDFPLGGIAALDRDDAADHENILLVPDGSMDKAGRADITLAASKDGDAVDAYPNPLARNSFAVLYFTRPPAAADVRVYGEDGFPVRSLQFQKDQKLWSWDLADEAGRAVKPGVYYYRAGEGPVKVLYLSPGK